MKTSTEFFDIIYRTVRVLPTFVFIAVSGIVLVRETHAVPADRAAIFVGVPMVLGFFIIRVLNLSLPAGKHRGDAIEGGRKGVPLWFVLGFTCLFITLFSAVDGVLSVIVFRRLGYPELADIALSITKTAFWVTIGVVSAVAVFSLRNTMVEISDALLLNLWKILLLPRRLADSIPGLVQHPHRHN